MAKNFKEQVKSIPRDTLEKMCVALFETNSEHRATIELLKMKIAQQDKDLEEYNQMKVVEASKEILQFMDDQGFNNREVEFVVGRLKNIHKTIQDSL